MTNTLPIFTRPSAKKTSAVAACLLQLSFGAALLGSGGQALAFSEPEFQSALQLMIAPGGSEERAAEAFSALLKQEPANPLLMAYAGTATARLAVSTVFPWKKMSYAEEGLAMLDKALQLVANVDGSALHGSTAIVLEVKFTAGNTFLAVPGFMNRAARGSKLLDEVLESKQFEQAALGFRGAVWMRAAKLALEQKRTEDARRYLNEIISHNAPQQEAAKGILKGVA